MEKVKLVVELDAALTPAEAAYLVLKLTPHAATDSVAAHFISPASAPTCTHTPHHSSRGRSAKAVSGAHGSLPRN